MDMGYATLNALVGKNSRVALVGAPGLGKTMLALQILSRRVFSGVYLSPGTTLSARRALSRQAPFVVTGAPARAATVVRQLGAHTLLVVDDTAPEDLQTAGSSAAQVLYLMHCARHHRHTPQQALFHRVDVVLEMSVGPAPSYRTLRILKHRGASITDWDIAIFRFVGPRKNAPQHLVELVPTL